MWSDLLVSSMMMFFFSSMFQVIVKGVEREEESLKEARQGNSYRY